MTDNDSESTKSYVCSECESPVKFEDTVCPKCGADISEIDDDETLVDNSPSPKSKFQSLSMYSEFITFIGWLVIVVGIFFIIVPLANQETVQFINIVGGCVICISGFGLIAFAQIIKCLLSIESNTSEMNKQLLKYFENNMKS